MKNQQRLNLLTEEEVNFLYEIPKFTDAERRHFFSLPETLLEQLKLQEYPYNDNKISQKLYFILQFGYFKAKHILFAFKYTTVMEDVKFIMQHYFPKLPLSHNIPIKNQQTSVKRTILAFFGFQNESKETHRFILERTAFLAKIIQDPHTICLEVIKSLTENKMVLPKYSTLQDKIGVGLKKEEERLRNMIKKEMPKKVVAAINNLLRIEDFFYNITELKFDPKCFQKQEIEAEIEKLEKCKLIFEFSQKFLPKTNISRKNIVYYSDLAKFYTVDSLKDLPKELAHFYLLCYVNQRCECIIDNLIKGFIYYVDKYSKEGKKHAKNNIPESKSDLETHRKPIGHLIKIFTDDELMRSGRKKICKAAFKIMPKKEISEVSVRLLDDTPTRKDLEIKSIWKYHKKHYRVILINLRPLFLAIDFESTKELKNLMKAIRFLKKHLAHEKLSGLTLENCPTQHITSEKLLSYFIEEKSYGTKNEKINIYQYEFHLYNLIRENLKKQKIFVNNSLEYKDFDEDIKKPDNWNKEKKKILKELNNEVLLKPIENTLVDLENFLEPLITRVNARIANGENKFVKIKKHRNGETTWTLPYPKKDDEFNNPFYNKLDLVTISEGFDFVEQRCGFMKAFKNFKQKYAKIKRDYVATKGVIMANGTAQGIYRFSKKSNLKYQRLRITEKNNIRLETLRNAAAIIVDHLIQLPIYTIYNLGGKRHGSIDGTKKKTQRRTIKARYSPKYFGLDLGIVIMTMTLNNIPFITNIIGANEHESHFSYEMLLNNITAIDPDIISTDTAGTNNLNDFLYYVIGKVHAACYRSVVDKAKKICGFKPPSAYRKLLIKPTKTVNRKRAKKNWPEILPILTAVLSHETSQHIIIKKLSSHDYKSDVKDALWELNDILKSIHILKYIDDPDYRRNIRAALNRGEAGHQMLDKVINVGNGTFRGMSDLEVEIWNECTRLLILIILYYNAYILSKLYEIKVKKNDKAAIEYLKHISLIAIQHINLDGFYELAEPMANINVNVDNAVSTLNKVLNKILKSRK
jgi:TnpA family transposase